MTIMQLLVSTCAVLLAIVGWGFRGLVTQLIQGQKELTSTLGEFVAEVRDYHAKNDLELQRLNLNLESFKKECAWTHSSGRRRQDIA